MNSILPPLFRFIIRTIVHAFMRVKITGIEHVQGLENQGLIIVSNHFSYFEVPLLAYELPRFSHFFGAAELRNKTGVRQIINAHPGQVIFVKRGQADRQALQQAVQHLKADHWMVVFPEGGITEETIALSSQGQHTADQPGNYSRATPELLPAQPGAAFMALRSGTQILPVAFLGTDQVLQNIAKLRRTTVEMRIGEPFGPLSYPEGARGQEKRDFLNDSGHLMMQKIAELLPAENRGFYQDGR